MAKSTRTATRKSGAANKSTESGARTQRRVSRRASSTRRNQLNSTTDSDAQSDQDESDAYIQSGEDDDDDDVLSINSDTLDDPDFDTSGRKRKRGLTSKNSSPKKSRFFSKSPSKKKRASASDDEVLKDGVEVVGTVVQAPKTGRGMFQSNLPFALDVNCRFSTPWPNFAKYYELP
ncbi:hypothetical protein ACEPAH_2745 [Sanghuangporus vaninii]